MKLFDKNYLTGIMRINDELMMKRNDLSLRRNDLSLRIPIYYRHSLYNNYKNKIESKSKQQIYSL